MCASDPFASRARAAKYATSTSSASEKHEPRKLETGRTQAPSAKSPSFIAVAEKRALPPTMPKMYGSASGFRSTLCSTAPATARAAPTVSAASIVTTVSICKVLYQTASMVYYSTIGMSNLLSRIHTRVGDLWWYSAMIFIACRSGDVIQAFIGLWLVPKYVGPQELGAVLPLQQLSGLFAVPLAVIATVFAKYVNVYATRGEYGKVKSFIHDVLLASSVIFLVCIAGAFLIAPFFYERLRISSGLLTVLILAAGFTGNVAALFTSALQGLKKFKVLSVVNIIGAPIRLVTLLIGMPVRALSGYVLGQATPPASTALVAALSLRKD